MSNFLCFALLVTTSLCNTISAQLLPSTLNSMKQSAMSLQASAGNHHTIACYPDGALTYYEHHGNSVPGQAVLTGSFVYNKNATTVKTFDLAESIYVKDFKHYL